MKHKIIAIGFLIAAILFTAFGCQFASTDIPQDNTTMPPPQGITRVVSENYVPLRGGFAFREGTDFGTFQKPHALGEQVTIDYIDAWGYKTTLEYSVNKVLIGDEAKQWLDSQGFTGFQDEDFYYNLDDYDLVIANIQRNELQKVAYPTTHLGACNEAGDVVSEFDMVPSLSETEGGITEISPNVFSGWKIVLIPKNRQYTIALFIGELLEEPGIVATFYFAKK